MITAVFARSARAALVNVLAVALLASALPPWAMAVASSAPARPTANGHSFPALRLPAAAPSTAAIAATKRPCPPDIAEGWKCITLTLPADHFTDTGMTTEVTFALKRHTGTGPAKGTWVTITGGPGTAGIYSAVGYSETFAESIRRDYDLVFMDQRGSGMSGGFTCPQAALDLYTTQAGADDPDGGAALRAASRDFVDDCLDESDVDPEMLPYYATKQAVEDLEAFRVWLGVEQLSLYGESYGTQYVQTYAAAHPDRVKILFLDGPVDLATEGPAYYVEGTEAFDQVLVATMLDCTVQAECSRDVKGGNELTAYDQLATQLANGPIEYTFTYGDGTQEQRQFTLTDLENAAANALYNTSGRRLLQRAMAAGSHGHVWWLARLAYGGVVQDPETLEPIPDPAWSDALFYAVECLDYPYFRNAGTRNERARAYIDYGRRHGVYDMRLPGSYTGDLPCVYWPEQPGPNPRPVPSADADYPLVVLGSTLDPATPFGNAERIFDSRGDNPAGTWLIYKPGGAHVIYGRGDACPDDLVTRMLVRNKFPKQSIVACPGDVADDYVRNRDAEQIIERGARALLFSYDDEINYGVDYWYWDFVDPLSFGCAFGGTIKYTPTSVGSRLKLKSCSFVEGARATGTGFINDVTGAFRLDVNFSGDWEGKARYRRTPNGHRSLTGNLAYTASP